MGGWGVVVQALGATGWEPKCSNAAKSWPRSAIHPSPALPQLTGLRHRPSTACAVNRVELLAKKITELGYSCFYIHAKMLQVGGRWVGVRGAQVVLRGTR